MGIKLKLSVDYNNKNVKITHFLDFILATFDFKHILCSLMINTLKLFCCNLKLNSYPAATGK